MKNSTFMRALSILVPLAVYLGISRYITYRLVLDDFENKSGDYFRHGSGPFKTEAPTYLNVDTGFMDWSLGHLFGLFAIMILALIIAGIVLAIRYIFDGPSQYVDPCRDPECPCRRHVVERQQAADASNLALGVAVGTAIGVSIGNI